jgi:hypothetical protein
LTFFIFYIIINRKFFHNYIGDKMSKVQLLKKIYEAKKLTSGFLYELLAEYNGGQVAIEMISTIFDNKRKKIILYGVIDFLQIEQINNQEVVKITFTWTALQSKYGYLSSNIKKVTLSKYQAKHLQLSVDHPESLVLFLHDEDEDEVKLHPKKLLLVRIDLIDANDINYLPFERVKKE